MLEKIIMKVRPAPLATVIKTVIGARRVEYTSNYGTFWIDRYSNFGMRLRSAEGYEPDVTEAIQRLARSARTFVDIGANEGYFSVVAARAMAAGGRVVAVEPQRRLAPVLERNFSLNRVSVQHVPTAISDVAGQRSFYLASSMNNGASGFARPARYSLRQQLVQTTTLDVLLASFSTVDLVKMDIEGFEYEAILSSSVFAERRVGALILELHPESIRERGLDPNRIAAALSGWGYGPSSAGNNTLWLRDN